METVVSPPAEADLQLLTRWGDPFERRRSRQAAVLSVAAHAALIAVLIWVPLDLSTPPEPEEKPVVERITPLIDPPRELTQKAPDQGAVAKRFNAAEIAPRPRIQAPPGVPAPQRGPGPSGAPLPPAPAPKQAVAAPPPAPLPEPPKIEGPPREAAHTTLPPAVTPPPLALPPAIQSEEHKPSSPFETPSGPPPPSPNARSPFGNPVEEALRQVVPTPDGRLMVGDSIYGVGGAAQAMQRLPPGLGSPGSAVELLTDVQGVDFRNYLYRVLTSVRQHWQAILPESVTRLGRRGTVAIQFAIDRRGGVPKLVIVPGRSSGADALDRAAIAGISASVPFPPLPSDYKGDRIVLQFEFAYNMPKK